MRTTKRQLRRIIREVFAATAEEEAEKVNAQTGISLVTDQAFWEEMGVSTGEELAKSLLSSTYSDYYKDLHGIRPRWMADKIKSMSVEEIQTLIDDLDKEAETMVADEKWEEENLPGWEDEMIAAVKAHPEDVPEEYLEYETLPQQTGMGRRTEGIMRITRRQLRRIIREQGNLDADLVNWNQLKVGDRIAVESGDYYYEPVEILQKLEDISLRGSEEAGLGFVGTDPLGRSGDTIVFPIRDVVQENLTRRQHRRIIREAIDPREMEEPIGGWIGDALKNDPDFKHHTDTGPGEAVFWKEGDLVRTIDYQGDGWGGDYEKIVGDQIGQVVEVDEDMDGTQYTVLFPDGTTVMDVGAAFEIAR